MEPTTSSSWNLNMNSSTFWSNGGSRKRKAAVTDLDEKINQKMFVTEDKMVKDMQTLSLELAALQDHQNVSPSPPSPIEEEPLIEEANENEIEETHLELHQLLKDSLKNDDLQDHLISKLCENERRKLTMQIVPYIPIHPAQLNKSNVTDDNQNSSDESKSDNDDHVFKIPSIPTPYTVEEPCDSAIKRAPTMKRSYSQSNQSNSNLSVTELKPDGSDYSSIHHPQTAYFIVEPTATSLAETSSNGSNSSLSSNDPSVRITEFLDLPTSNNELTSVLDDDDIDMQSVASSDTGDKMDDD